MDWRSLFDEVNKRAGFDAMQHRLDLAYKSKVKQVYPEKERIFRAFDECPFDTLKVVWIGQDPYHDGKATGLSMGIENSSVPPTLRILNECCKFEFGTPIEDFSLLSWAKQGVLLLNAALTVERKKPGSHSKFWESYIEELLQEIADNKQVVWVALGKNSQVILDKVNGIEKDNILRAPHPMVAQYSGKVQDYLDLRIFTQINDKLSAIGFDKIRFNSAEGSNVSERTDWDS